MEINNPIIVISGPSGSGKSTIFKHLLNTFNKLSLAVSATTRPIRGNEVDGQQYQFLTEEEFRQKIANNELLEYEEVYPGRFYGTQISEIHRIANSGKVPLLELDVLGAINIKKMFPDRAYLIFINPPSITELENRLRARGTETEENIQTRLKRAEYEISQKDNFDTVIQNNDLEIALNDAVQIVGELVK